MLKNFNKNNVLSLAKLYDILKNIKIKKRGNIL